MPIKNLALIAFLLALFIFMWWKQPVLEKFESSYCPYNKTEAFSHRGGTYPADPNRPPDYQTYDEGVIQEPTYLNQKPVPESTQYAQSVIDRQAHQIRSLRQKVKQLALRIDDQGNNKFYRRKLSNKYYRPKPFLSHGFDNVLNLGDDDFSTKTLSTIKFLSQTRSSRYFGDEIHFPTELCGHYCTTSDPNAEFHEQIDLVRPISPTNYINKAR